MRGAARRRDPRQPEGVLERLALPAGPGEGVRQRAGRRDRPGADDRGARRGLHRGHGDLPGSPAVPPEVPRLARTGLSRPADQGQPRRPEVQGAPGRLADRPGRPRSGVRRSAARHQRRAEAGRGQGRQRHRHPGHRRCAGRRRPRALPRRRRAEARRGRVAGRHPAGPRAVRQNEQPELRRAERRRRGARGRHRAHRGDGQLSQL